MICGFGQAVADEWVQGTKDTANATRDKATDATQSAAHSVQQKKDEGAGFLQQVLLFTFSPALPTFGTPPGFSRDAADH